MTLRWPIVQFPYVLHVGELDAALKGKTGHASSYEGSGLSVSRHPKEWEQIARLGGSPTWKIKHASGGISLLDAHALDQRLRQEIAQWAGDQGLCAEGTVFKLWREDEEGEQRFSLYASQAEARVELGGLLDCEDETARLEAVRGLLPTPQLEQRMGFRVNLLAVEDLILTCFVEDVLAPAGVVMGAWWNDVLDPCSYSAPRGVLPKALVSGLRDGSNEAGFSAQAASPQDIYAANRGRFLVRTIALGDASNASANENDFERDFERAR